ncbi:hypothetical protein HIM_03895 [Hirsutella minnesotensis 3608]|uniref:Fungal lipase-type domain-containing protein n=1 Tax=Hirsutella minnesotensis 3608 TaxID=1043627 RepID=A0A0F8A669_9HYPO|nr:hypothetical protein HIM_03895 [Hirsutella minnesotensis 3608]
MALRLLLGLFTALLLNRVLGEAIASASRGPIGHENALARPASISTALFADLERLSRIVDISYCVGNTGVRKPFECLSRCSDFPDLSLVTTWNTGVLLSDSCGYIAVDASSERERHPGSEDSNMTNTSYASHGTILVAFRGTYSITNTIVDLSTIPQQYIPYPAPDDGDKGPLKKPKHECANCTVHMGFLESWRNARKVILPELKALKAKHPSSPIHLVGHSLGGAVACLAALELKVSLEWDDVRVTTFGEPRLGNYQLARFIDKVFGLNETPTPESWSYRRVTHIDDPVPLLPWDEWGYKPHAGEVFISKPDLPPSEKDIRSCFGDSDPLCSESSGGSSRQAAPQSTLRENHVAAESWQAESRTFPTRLKLWQLFFAHRDYFWRLGLCVPGGDPADWGRTALSSSEPNEL